MFTPTWGNDPVWLIFFKWVETTNQIVINFGLVFPPPLEKTPRCSTPSSSASSPKWHEEQVRLHVAVAWWKKFLVGTIGLATWMVDLHGKCRNIYHRWDPMFLFYLFFQVLSVNWSLSGRQPAPNQGRTRCFFGIQKIGALNEKDTFTDYPKLMMTAIYHISYYGL